MSDAPVSEATPTAAVNAGETDTTEPQQEPSWLKDRLERERRKYEKQYGDRIAELEAQLQQRQQEPQPAEPTEAQRDPEPAQPVETEADIKARRLEALIDAELDKDALEFITATDADGIAAQVQKLRDKGFGRKRRSPVPAASDVNTGDRVFKRSQLSDFKFFSENREAIMRAARGEPGYRIEE